MLRRAGGLLLHRCAGSLEAAQRFGAQETRGIAVSVPFVDAPNRPAVSQVPIEEEWYNRQRNIVYLDSVPWIQPDTWIAPNAVVAGDVDIYDAVS